jgi:hypothetical protein
MKVSRRAKPIDKMLARRVSDDGYKFDEQGILVRKKPWKSKQREREPFPIQLTLPKQIKLPPVPKTGRGTGRQQILLTEVRAHKILCCVMIGLFKPQIASLAGITRECLHNWLTKGKENMEAIEAGKPVPYWEGFTIFKMRYDEAENWIEMYMIKKMFDGAQYTPEAAERFLARRFPERWGKVPGQDGNARPSETHLHVGVDYVTLLNAAQQQVHQRRIGIVETVEINGKILPADPRPPRALPAGDTESGRKIAKGA